VGEPEDGVARPTNVTETLVASTAMPKAFRAPAVVWSADRAVTELYASHYRGLVRLAAFLVRDTPTAEEVVQDAFVAMADGWQRLRDAEKALAYLRQAVVNRSRSVLRHRTVVDKNLQKAPPDMPSAEHGALVLLERSAVVSALRELPNRQRWPGAPGAPSPAPPHGPPAQGRAPPRKDGPHAARPTPRTAHAPHGPRLARNGTFPT
jgi:hypothetical protein